MKNKYMMQRLRKAGRVKRYNTRMYQKGPIRELVYEKRKYPNLFWVEELSRFTDRQYRALDKRLTAGGGWEDYIGSYYTAEEAYKDFEQDFNKTSSCIGQRDNYMSWNINYVGHPNNIKAALEKESERLTGSSKEEFDIVKPHIAALLSQTYNNNPGADQPLIKLSANGHSHSTDGQPIYGHALVNIEFVGGTLV